MKNSTRSFILLMAVGLAMLLPVASAARVWNILPDGSGDAPTIQAAIDSCIDGDIVELDRGTYTYWGNRDLDFMGKQITVRGATGDADDCVIDCQGDENENHRGFIFQGGETADSRLESLTITNGYVESPNTFPDGCGGGILVINGSSPTLQNLTLRANRSMEGGGITIFDSEADLRDCRFVDNRAPWGGGGGVSAFYWNPREPVSDCLFQGNSTHQAGGGLACSASELVVLRCQFLENSVDEYGYGGGFFAHLDTDIEFEDCTFARNTCTQPSGGCSGGGLNIWNGSCKLSRCTIVENETRDDSSGIYCQSPLTLEIRNCIIAFGDAEAITGGLEGDVIVECTDIYGNQGGDWTGPIASLEGVFNNLNVDPQFCGNANADYPYTLQENSPCRPSTYPCAQVGAWGVGCSDVSAVTAPRAAAPIHFAVAPNPFNPQTNVSFFTDQPRQVRVEVFDIRGRRIAEITDRQYPAGEHSEKWQGRDSAGRAVPSGEYFFRVECGGQVETLKAILLR